jgi:hypothetical protein
MRKFTFVLLLTLAACQAPLRSAEAQSYHCIWTGNVSICTQLAPPIQHRSNPEARAAARAERNYYDRAYEYELRRLEQENRR